MAPTGGIVMPVSLPTRMGEEGSLKGGGRGDSKEEEEAEEEEKGRVSNSDIPISVPVTLVVNKHFRYVSSK